MAELRRKWSTIPKARCISAIDSNWRTIWIADAHCVKSAYGIDPASGTWSATGSCCATFYSSQSQPSSCNFCDICGVRNQPR